MHISFISCSEDGYITLSIIQFLNWFSERSQRLGNWDSIRLSVKCLVEIYSTQSGQLGRVSLRHLTPLDNDWN